jgi:cell division protein ZapA (FtsZ GTPase activity inhibitor)
VTVNIFGADYAIRASADPEYIRRMAKHVDGLMREISARVKHASAARIAVLAALQLTDQLVTERQQAQSGQKALAEQTDLLLSRLDQTLLEVVE